MNSDLSNIKVGDWIWTLRYGWEKVTEIAPEDIYTVKATSWYTSDGKEHLGDKYPSAFIEPPEGFNADPKPCEFKKGDRVLVGDSLESCKHRRYLSHIDSGGNFHCFAFGKTEWSIDDDKTFIWKCCKKWEGR